MSDGTKSLHQIVKLCYTEPTTHTLLNLQIKTTNPYLFRVMPSTGYLYPKETLEVKVTLLEGMQYSSRPPFQYTCNIPITKVKIMQFKILMT